MARDTMAFSRIAGRRRGGAAVLTTLDTAVVLQPLEAIPVAEVAGASPAITREAVLFPQARIDEARVVNAAMFDSLRPIRIRPGRLDPGLIPDPGMSQAELGLPVADADPLNPDGLFTAADGSSKSYLARYELARRVVSGAEQYELRIAPGADGQAALRLVLRRVRPASVPADVVAGELEHGLMVQLRYSVLKSDGGTITKTLDFTEIGETEDRSAIVAQMRFSSLAERDQVLSAITTATSACGLVATRSVRVGVPIAGQPGRFRPVTRGMVQTVDPDPLFLNAALHPYVFQGVAPQGERSPGLVARQVAFDGSFHDYWEDAVDPACIYYLPDAFRLARRESPAPFAPMMVVRVAPGPTPEAEPVVTMEFAATPWSNLRRLSAARRDFALRLPAERGAAAATPAVPELGDALGGLLGELLRKNKATADTPLGDLLGEALGMEAQDARLGRIRMEPLPVEKATFWLALPGATGGGLVERPAAQVDLRTAVIVSETLPLSSFQAVYDALMGGSVSLMKGEVRFDLGNGTIGRIPFEARFDQMNGPMFDTKIKSGAKPGHFTITLTNAVESPVKISAIDGSLVVGGHEIAANEGFSTPLPLQLLPGQSLNVGVQPKRQLVDLPGGPKIAPILDFSRVVLVPDSERLWEAILDADTSAEARRKVRVKLFPGMFDAPSGKPEDRAFAVIVQFDGGPSLELTPEKAEGEVVLAGGSITDLVLRRGQTGGYRYRCQVIRRSVRLNDADWRQDTTDLLIPLLPEG